MLHRDQIAVRVEHAAHPIRGHRFIPVVLRVVFALPNDLDRRLDRFAHPDCVVGEVGVQPSTKSAAEIGRVNLHFVWGHAGDLGGRGLSDRLHLGRRPNLDAVARH